MLLIKPLWISPYIFSVTNYIYLWGPCILVALPSTACVRAARCSSLLSASRASSTGLNTFKWPGQTQTGIPQTPSLPWKGGGCREPAWELVEQDLLSLPGEGPWRALPLPCHTSALGISDNQAVWSTDLCIFKKAFNLFCPIPKFSIYHDTGSERYSHWLKW